MTVEPLKADLIGEARGKALKELQAYRDVIVDVKGYVCTEHRQVTLCIWALLGINKDQILRQVERTYPDDES